MYNFLLDHAINNVWCTPGQDNELNIKPFRLSKAEGVLNSFIVMNKKIQLPDLGKIFHIFQIGQINPAIINLSLKQTDLIKESWNPISDIINNSFVQVNIYNSHGIELPRFKTYYMFTKTRDLIIAIEQDLNIPINYKTDDIYIRLYANAYFNSVRSNSVTEHMFYYGKTIKLVTEIHPLQLLFETYQSKLGFTSAYVNGLLVDKLDMTTVNVFDTIEFIYDSSVKRVVTFNVRDLLTFNSVLDSKYKYLLHYNNGLNDTIDYQDDTDIQIIYQNDINRYKGCLYHRNSEDSVRMVTHRDYSIVVDYFADIADNLNSVISNRTLDIRDFKIQLKIKNSGYQRPLIQDNNRIFELYKLSDQLALQAMIGVNATVAEWKAENLENSNYTKLMRSNYSDINTELIQYTYGYNSISKLVGDSPIKTILKSGKQYVKVPYNCFTNSTVYEYDINGLLLEYHTHTTGSDYYANNNNTRLVEFIYGQATDTPSVKFGFDNISLPLLDNFRVYLNYVDLSGNLVSYWRDVTESNYYHIENNILKSNNLEPAIVFMVRDDSKFLAFDLDLVPESGNLYFTLYENEDRGLGLQPYSLPVPLGELDIILNGKSLIRGLDYIINFPTIYIINKKYLIQQANISNQHIHVRFTGFCDSDLTLDNIEEYGFIEYGLMSNNNKFDIRDDKVLRITLDGGLVHRDDVIMSEEHIGVNLVDSKNGLPYQIKDTVVPLRNLTNENTYSLRDISLAIDTRISNYLTVYHPQPNRTGTSSIIERYKLYSPFISRLLFDLVNNNIDPLSIAGDLSDMEVLTLCNSYEFLLDFDPINPLNLIDGRFVDIHPHMDNSVLGLTLQQYKFIQSVVRLYGNNLITLSPFINLSV